MTNVAQRSSEDIARANRQVRESYDAFKAKGLKLNLTRGKPSSAQLDLSAALLSLPGSADYIAEGATDCRNYGGLQGWPKRANCSPGSWEQGRNKWWSPIIPASP